MSHTFHRSAALLIALVLILCAANPTLSASALTGRATSGQLPVVHMPKDVRPPDVGYDPISTSDRLVASGNLVYYIADDYVHGRELWVSDGTSLGTHMVKEFFPGKDGFPYSPYSSSLSGQAVGDHSLLLSVSGSDSDDGYYRTDGTEAGTVRLGDDPGVLFLFENQYFTLGGEPVILKTFDVTNGATSLAAVLTGNCFVSEKAIGPWLYIISKDSSGPGCRGKNAITHLWKTDGTSGGTSQIKEISDTRYLSSQVSTNDNLFFMDINNLPTQHINLWISDGTSGGTNIVMTFPEQGSGYITPIAAANGLAFFYSAGEVRGLWQSDGTEAGTFQIQDSGPCMGGLMFPFNDALYLLGSDCQGHNTWYKTGGKAAGGIIKLLDYAPDDDPDPDNPNTYLHTFYYEANGQLYLHGDSGSGHNVWWVTDGTSLTALVGSQVYLAPDNPVVVGSNLFFSAWDAEAGNELWMSDGTPTGTVRLADLHANEYPGDTKSSLPQNLTAAGDSLFFTANDGIHGRQLWVAGPAVTKRIYIPLAMR